MMRGTIPRGATLVALALVSFTGQRAWGQRPAVRPLTLGWVYAEIDARAPMLASASASARAAEARIPPAGTLPDPMLELGTVNRNLRNGGLMDITGMNMIGARQTIPLAGKPGLAAAVARGRARAAVAQIETIRWTLRLEAASAFTELFFADRAVEVMRETRRLLENSSRAAEAMYASGQGRQADVLRAQTEVTRMEEEIIRMISMRRQAAARLSAVIDAALDPDTLVVDAPPLAAPAPDLAAGLARALEAGPAQRTARASVDAARDAERLARRDVWPDLDLGLQYGWRPMTGGTDHMWSVTIGMSLPVFAGRRQLQMRQEARAMIEMAEEDARATAADTRARVGEAWARLEEASRLVELYRTALVPQTEAALRSAEAAYRAGTVDYMTLLDSQMTLNRYRQELYRAHANASLAATTLELLAGAEPPPAVPVEGDRQ